MQSWIWSHKFRTHCFTILILCFISHKQKHTRKKKSPQTVFLREFSPIFSLRRSIMWKDSKFAFFLSRKIFHIATYNQQWSEKISSVFVGRGLREHRKSWEASEVFLKAPFCVCSWWRKVPSVCILIEISFLSGMFMWRLKNELPRLIALQHFWNFLLPPRILIEY